jgi:hypothetical protein
VEIELVDYDADITNTAAHYCKLHRSTGVTNPVTVSSGVTFNADNDPESIAIALDGDGITEGSERWRSYNCNTDRRNIC